MSSAHLLGEMAHLGSWTWIPRKVATFPWLCGAFSLTLTFTWGKLTHDWWEVVLIHPSICPFHFGIRALPLWKLHPLSYLCKASLPLLTSWGRGETLVIDCIVDHLWNKSKDFGGQLVLCFMSVNKCCLHSIIWGNLVFSFAYVLIEWRYCFLDSRIIQDSFDCLILLSLILWDYWFV